MQVGLTAAVANVGTQRAEVGHEPGGQDSGPSAGKGRQARSEGGRTYWLRAQIMSRTLVQVSHGGDSITSTD